MSIRTRLEDARVLSSAGRREGAFVQVLIAAAATSRKRYPRDIWEDSESFKNFIYDELGVITNGMKYEVAFPFQGTKTPLEDILYHHLRCQLVHEGEMPESVEFTEPKIEDGTLYNSLHLGTPLGFPAGWIKRLATAVWLAPENDELWQDESEKRAKAIAGLGTLWEEHKFSRRPNKQTREMKKKNPKREQIVWNDSGTDFTLSYTKGITLPNACNAVRKKLDTLAT